MSHAKFFQLEDLSQIIQGNVYLGMFLEKVGAFRCLYLLRVFTQFFHHIKLKYLWCLCGRYFFTCKIERE